MCALLKRECLSVLIPSLVLFVVTAGRDAQAESSAGQARQILSLAPRPTGLCIHLGCGREGSAGLLAELAADSEMLVHGLALDEASLARARHEIEARGLLGRAAVEKLPLDPLPYVRDLANLVVIEDAAALSAAGLKAEEIQRITAPGGVICTAEKGRWTKTVKARPQQLGEWTHPTHGPDGNLVSEDRAIGFPVGLRWLDGVPMNFNLWASCRGVVVAGGRVFSLNTAELENVSPAAFIKHQQHEYLLARDAFNGLPLWKIDCETLNDGQALNLRNTAALVTDGHRVYVFKKDRLVAVDAATGQVVQSFAVKYPTVRLLLDRGVLVSAGWEERHAPGLWDPWVTKSPNGATEAFDPQTGKLKWTFAERAQQMLAADGTVYVLLEGPAPETHQAIVALDLATGREKWRVDQAAFPLALQSKADPKARPQPRMQLGVAGRGVLVVPRPKARTISVLAAEDGKTLWEIPNTASFWVPMVDGLVWHDGKKLDPRTGTVKGQFFKVGGPGICTPCNVVGPYVTNTRGCAYHDYTQPDQPHSQRAKTFYWRAARGACIEAVVPAQGMFYTSQNNCRCSPGQVPGFLAFGPCGQEPSASDFAKARPVEKGPAFGAVKPAAVAAADWPVFLGDASRSGATSAQVPGRLQALWQTPVTAKAGGPLSSAWSSRLMPIVTAPVSAGGLVVVAATQTGQVVALDATSGRPRWRFSAGARIDSPPSLAAGLCLFGAHDGYVYALGAADGRLAWRVRVAPQERRMIAFGQVESVWPAIGTVLALDKVVYACAGRSTESDGGVAVCALDLATGRQLWAGAVGPGPQRQIDALMLQDGKLVMRPACLDLETGKPVAAAPAVGFVSGLEGIIDGAWTRIGNRRSGDHNFGRVKAELFTWNDNMVYGCRGTGRSCFAVSRAKLAEPVPPVPKGKQPPPPAFAWQAPLPANHQAEALVLSANGLLLAVRKYDPNTNQGSAFLWLMSTTDGKRLAEYPLPSPAVYEGLALAGARVYVSLQDGSVACLGGAR